MAAMMWFMMRGGQNQGTVDSRDAPRQDLARLQAEVDQLRAAQRPQVLREAPSAPRP